MIRYRATVDTYSQNTVARYWAKVDRRGPDECWPWTASVDGHSYGQLAIRIDGRRTNERAHRMALALAGRPAAPGQPVDHLCHTRDSSCPGGPACLHRRCQNPAHLEPVSVTENNRRDRERRTHCRRGHEFTPENTIWRRDTRGYRDQRFCRTCHRDKQNERRRRTV